MAYISNELGKDECRKVEMHLQICASCRRVLTSLQVTNEMLGVWDEIDPPEELSNRFEARLAEEAQRGETKSLLIFRWLSSPIPTWFYASSTAVCFITAVILGLYILLSPGENTSSARVVHHYDAYRQGDIQVNFYISEHENTLKHATLQRVALPRETPIRIPIRRENIMYYDEISGASKEPEDFSSLILKSKSGWNKEDAEGKSHEEVLDGKTLTLEEAKESVSFDIIAPSVIRGDHQLTMVRKSKDKECIQLVYSNGPSVISLFEQPLEVSEKLNRRDFKEYILRLANNEGRMAVLGWITEQLSFNLIGEITLSELMKIAEEIQERRLTDETRSYYQILYGGE